MIQDLIDEYLLSAERAATVDFTDKNSIRELNKSTDRMRVIVGEVASLGHAAIMAFTLLLDREPAALWAAHHLIEFAELDSETLSRCFSRVEQAKMEAKKNGNFANAIGEEMWLKEWKAKKAVSEQ
ncbi:hypothetical protein DTL42_18025 [Bremerella cremea]|uniref:Uncharacterized protein n=1 Tax=Bremerella cremea TaxID=1031537 RepID=A0A368KQ40_9BACT|nr:hypothetical protein [Bremerella cremea]RCS44029.1 hypothetical protein DTL42_18025 [Bremerella cremea]